jgi:hypothetical protein
LSDRHGINLYIVPPCDFISRIVKVSVMESTERDCEFVADLEADGARLRKL